MRKNHALIIDADKDVQEGVSELIRRNSDPEKTEIHRTSKLHKAKETLHQGVELGVMIIDNNVRGDVAEFISSLSSKKKGRVIVYSKDDKFRLVCARHHLKIVKKGNNSEETLESVVKEVLNR